MIMKGADLQDCEQGRFELAVGGQRCYDRGPTVLLTISKIGRSRVNHRDLLELQLSRGETACLIQELREMAASWLQDETP